MKNVIRLLEDMGLARLLRLGVAGAVPPLWLEIAILHFRGSFQSRFMWVPVLSLPVIFAGGSASFLLRNSGHTYEESSRALFRPLAWLMTLIGAVGTFFHLRGVGRQQAQWALLMAESLLWAAGSRTAPVRRAGNAWSIGCPVRCKGMKIEEVEVSAYAIPTDGPEADGTIRWDSTTVVIVEAICDSGE